ncbi:outer membrane beta-barrel protein [Caulobacter sp.]|uniref:outer membrane beta-barrel protein n=1 Tax=Caulobacter sp. TaxID=78 RepID=UPI002B46C40A|nr:outer membrane beta-barrel protein [Caulobacter sp.]
MASGAIGIAAQVGPLVCCEVQMKTLFLGAVIALLLGVQGAAAQDDKALTGFKVGAGFDFRAIQAKRSVSGWPSRVDERQGGAGYRAHVGYDVALGDGLLLGVEGGVGGGGKTLATRTAAGEYSLKPGFSYDASARVGIMPSTSVLLYGRAGYQWLKTTEKISFAGGGLAPLKHKETQSGILYGFGAEYAATNALSLRAEIDQASFGHGVKAAQVQLGGALRF